MAKPATISGRAHDASDEETEDYQEEGQDHSANDAAEGVATPRASYVLSQTYQENRRYLISRIEKLESPQQPFGTPNLLHGRYEIDVSKELSAYSRKYAKAYAVLDREAPAKQCIGYVVEYYYPHRYNALEKLRGQHHPHFIELLDAGIAFIESWQANRLVIVYERPPGERLSAFIERGEFIKASEVMKKIITPFASLLSRFASLDMAHGAICADNVYYDGSRIMLGECIAEPSNTMIPPVYQPIEMLMTAQDAMGGAGIARDIYNLAVLVLDACGELGTRRNLTQEQLIPGILAKGAYTVFVNESNLPDSLIDFFRATLLDAAYDRWGAEQLSLFAAGRRYNLIPPTPPRDSPRTYHFEGQDYITLRSMAHALATNWSAALGAIRDRNLLKWLDPVSYISEAKDRMAKLQVRAAKTSAKNAQADDVIARTICTLDPSGPVRYKHMALFPAQAPLLIASLMKAGDQHAVMSFRELMFSEIVGYWRDLRNENFKSLRWDPQNILQLMRFSSVGFGMERLMYELNPQLPCMSRDYMPYYAMNAKTMLIILDARAKEHAADSSFTDKHLIAFIAARAGVRKEVKVKDLAHYPDLYNSKDLKAAIILGRAQEKVQAVPLHGLTHWVALKLLEGIEQFHSREIRQRMSEDLRTILPRGKIAFVIKVLANKDYTTKDLEGFLRATAMHHKNAIKILKLKNKRMIWNRSKESGLRIAFLTSLLILFGVIYYQMAKYAL